MPRNTKESGKFVVAPDSSIPESLDYLVKRAHEAVDESALSNDQAYAEHDRVERCERVLSYALRGRR